MITHSLRNYPQILVDRSRKNFRADKNIFVGTFQTAEKMPEKNNKSLKYFLQIFIRQAMVDKMGEGV